MAQRISHISSEDEIMFSRDSAMERCFSPYKIQPRKATAETGDGCYAWFPKAEYIDNSGRVRAGAQDSNWKNHFERGQRTIISWLYDGEYPTDARKEPEIRKYPDPLYCFWCADHKGSGEKYKYVGTYIEDTNASEPRHRVYRLLRSDINLTQWYAHDGDFSYFNPEEDGLDEFRKLYIKSFRKQKQLLEDFINLKLPAIKRSENQLSQIVNEVSNHPLSRIDEHLTFIQSKLNEFDSTFFSAEQILKSSSMDAIGRLFMDILGASNNSHNRTIRSSILGQEITSKIYALYSMKYFLYSLSEYETEYYLDKLKLDYLTSDDLTEKHCLLHFWKQCNSSLDNLTPYEYYCFLQYAFGLPEKKAVTIETTSRISDDGNNIDRCIERPATTFLIAWNPDKWNEWPGGYKTIVEQVNSGKTYTESWTVYNSSAMPGDICYLMRLGSEPRGILAKGIVKTKIYQAPHWDPEKAKRGILTNHADIEFTEMIDFATDDIVSWDDLKVLFPTQSWTPENSGIIVKDECLPDLDDLWEIAYANAINSQVDKHHSRHVVPITDVQRINSEKEDSNPKLEDESPCETASEDYIYSPTPEKRADIENIKASSPKGTYPRDEKRKHNALLRSGFTCEANPSHESFISKRTGKRYVETHHLIPLEYWESFEYSLDVEANIVTLCSNCHNLIHYGKNAKELIDRLYEMREQELNSAGIGIDKQLLIDMYTGVFIKDSNQ